MKTFLTTHKPFSTIDPGPPTEPPPELPFDLKAMLRQFGSNSYAEGFFRFVTPPAFTECLVPWGLEPSECHVFLKCGFGHLVFFQDGEYKVLNPVINTIDTLADRQNLDFVMDILLCDRQSLENSFFLDSYEQAFLTLGAPNMKEIYAFVPAINIGGSRDAANVRKVKMQMQMELLSRM